MLELFDPQINLFPEGDAVKLIQNRFVKSLADAIALRILHLRLGVLNVIDRQEQLVVMSVRGREEGRTSFHHFRGSIEYFR